MKKSVVILYALVSMMIVGMPGMTLATVVGFDDLGQSGSDGSPVSSPYAGLNWSNFYYLSSNLYYIPSGYTKGTVSHNNVAFNAYGNEAIITSGTLWNFTGASFTGAWRDNLVITIAGSYKGTTLYSHTITVSSTEPLSLEVNWTGIDALSFVSSGGTDHGYPNTGTTQFAMDNLTFNINAVPIPSTVWLLCSGLIGLVGLRRKFRKSPDK